MVGSFKCLIVCSRDELCVLWFLNDFGTERFTICVRRSLRRFTPSNSMSDIGSPSRSISIPRFVWEAFVFGFWCSDP